MPLPLKTVASIGVATALLGACGHVNPYFDATRPHHRPGGFQNNDVAFEPKGLGALLRWRWDAWRGGLPPPPTTATPTVQPDLAFIRRNATAGGAMKPAVTWIGHATVLIQCGGLNVLTDPMFSDRASPVSFIGPRRAVAPGVALADLPRVDVVLVSHNHYDHLDDDSVRALNAQAGGPPLFVVPLGMKPWLADRGIDKVAELDWWQTVRVGPVDVVLTPVQHWSGRGLGDRLHTLWGGFAVLAPELHVFFAGDTGYSKDFTRVREHLADRQRDGGFDIALIPIGAYEPRWFMTQQHVNPAEAVRIHRDLGARLSLGVHWGTFQLTDESLDQPLKDLAAARREQSVAESDFFVLGIGQTRLLPRRPS